MAKTQNCRNCKFAQWHRNAAGAKQFGAWARCTFVPELPPLPASMGTDWRAREALAVIMAGARSVAASDNKPVDCPTWQAE